MKLKRPSWLKKPSFAWVKKLKPKKASFAWVKKLDPRKISFGWVKKLKPKNISFGWVKKLKPPESTYSWAKKLNPARLPIDRIPRPMRVALTWAGSALLAVLLVFGIDRGTNGGEILGSLSVSGVDIGGLDTNSAITRLQQFEDELRASPVPVSVGGRTFQLDLKQIAFELDEIATVEDAMRSGRRGNLFGQFGWWLTRFGSTEAMTPRFDYDSDRLEELIRTWELEGIAHPAHPGDIRVENGRLVYEYPATGTGIQRSTAIPALLEAMVDSSRTLLVLETETIPMPLTAADIDEAVLEARSLVEEDIALVEEDLGHEVIIPSGVLTRALDISLVEGSTPHWSFFVDSQVIGDYVSAFNPHLEVDAVNAEINIDFETDDISIAPSVPTREPDPESAALAAWVAMNSRSRTSYLTYMDGHDAEFTTADAEALGVKELIGEFTTFHPCCAARVTNIHLIADAVDGALVMPGEIFSLNDHVGQRTVEKGYVCAGALLGNEAVKEGPICIGGGTSQFATTLYNASFFAGLEDISHTPHSIYFTRYPEGREATIGWRYPELEFRNNTDNAIIIKTGYTGTSITVKIYGDNGGLKVTAGLSSRFQHTGIVTITRVNPSLAAPYCSIPTGLTVVNGSPGWTVAIYRYIEYPDGEMTTEKQYWHYDGAWRIIEYNPSGAGC